MTWSTVRFARAPQYWHVQPSRAKTARRVILRRCVSRGTLTNVTRRMTTGRGIVAFSERSSQRGVLDDLRLLLEQQHGGAPHRADVDRLVRGVQDEHTATLTSAPPVLRMRREPLWAWWRGLSRHDCAAV